MVGWLLLILVAGIIKEETMKILNLVCGAWAIGLAIAVFGGYQVDNITAGVYILGAGLMCLGNFLGKD